MGIETAVAIGTLVAAAGSVYQGVQAKKAADANARRIREEAEEEKRRAGLEQQQVLARTRAATGASGIRMSGSRARYVEDLSQNYQRELDWIGRSASSRASIARQEGRAGLVSGVTQGIGGLGKGLAQGKKAGWFS